MSSKSYQDQIWKHLAESAASGWRDTNSLLIALEMLSTITGNILISRSCPYCQGVLVMNPDKTVTCLHRPNHGQYIAYCEAHETVYHHSKQCEKCKGAEC